MAVNERYLVWDFDNTLAHRPGHWSQCLADLACEAQPKTVFHREQFVPHLRSGFPWHKPERGHPELAHPDAWWAHLAPVLERALILGASMEASLATSIARQVRLRYTAPEYWVVYPDVNPSLSALTRRGWRHLLLSNHVPELPQLVKELGLDEHFDAVYTSATLGFEKPHPLAFAAVNSALPANGRAVMVGDSFVADYQGALAAGFDAMLVRNTHPQCKYCFPDLLALLEYLKDG